MCYCNFEIKLYINNLLEFRNFEKWNCIEIIWFVKWFGECYLFLMLLYIFVCEMVDIDYFMLEECWM